MLRLLGHPLDTLSRMVGRFTPQSAVTAEFMSQLAEARATTLQSTQDALIARIEPQVKGGGR